MKRNRNGPTRAKKDTQTPNRLVYINTYTSLDIFQSFYNFEMMKTYWIVARLCFVFSPWHSGEPTMPSDFWKLNHSITECFRLLRMYYIISFRRQNLRLVLDRNLICILLCLNPKQDTPHTRVHMQRILSFRVPDQKLLATVFFRIPFPHPPSKTSAEYRT